MTNPPRNGEGDRSAQLSGGGGPAILTQPIRQVKRARRLRKEMSLPQVLLWRELRKRPGGYKFRREVPIAPFTVDFACLTIRLGIEIDGAAHGMGENPHRDIARDENLKREGFTVLRIPARDVLNDLESVVTAIVARCKALGPLHPRAARGGPPPRPGEDFS